MAEEEGVTPTLPCYDAALRACERSGRWRQAQRVLKRMERQGVPPSATSVGALIGACERAGEVGVALRTLQTMGRRYDTTSPPISSLPHHTYYSQ